MTIKESINKHFEKSVKFDFYTETYDETDFWLAWGVICKGMSCGIQWFFDWHQDQPPLSDKREEFIKKAVDNYIRKNLKKVYTNGVF